MKVNQLIDSINNEITVDGQLPFTVPKRTIIRNIKEAKKWFYKNYELALEDGYLYIDLNAHGFVCDNYIQLPNEIKSVFGVHPTGQRMLGDFSLEKMAISDYFKTRNGSGGGKLDMSYYVATQIQIQQLQSILQKKVSFDYNENTHRLFIKGWRPNGGGLILQAYHTIEDDMLFEDEIFFRYVVAKCKIALSRVIGTVTMPLMGGAQIDFSLIRDEGMDELEKIKEEVKQQRGVDYFFTQ